MEFSEARSLSLSLIYFFSLNYFSFPFVLLFISFRISFRNNTTFRTRTMSHQFFAPSSTKKQKRSPTPVAALGSTWLLHSILAKPRGWITVITESFTYVDPEGNFTKATSCGESVKHLTCRCNIEGKDGEKCDHPTPMQVGKGTGNAFKHLCNAHFNGDENAVAEAYVDALELQEKSSSGGTLSKFVSVESASSKEKAIFDWIVLMVMDNIPLSSVNNSHFRQFSKHRPEDVFSVEMIKETLIQLWALVELLIADEMKQVGIGAIMHDAWSEMQTHFLGLIAVYNKQFKLTEDGVTRTIEKVQTVLLAVSPMLKVSDNVDGNEDGEAEEATTFTAEVHANFIHKKFEHLGIKFDYWTLCQIADNCSTNRKLAKLLAIYQVGCNNHKFQLDLQDMVKSDDELRVYLDYVKEIVDLTRYSLKNSATVRCFTDVKMGKPSKVRWSGNCGMSGNYTKALPAMKLACATGGTTAKFSSKLKRSDDHFEYSVRSTKMLAEANIVTKCLQRKHDVLYNSQKTIKAFDERIKRKRAAGDKTHPLYHCTFVRNRTLPDGPLSPDHKFESAVCRVQGGAEQNLDFAEKSTLNRVLKTAVRSTEPETDLDDDCNATPVPGSPGLLAEIKQAEAKRKAASSRAYESKYVNLDFVLGSAAEVERLWSMAKYVLVQQRRSMAPKMFECLMFLKFNRRFWDEALVIQAFRNARNKKRSDRALKLATILATEEAEMLNSAQE